MALSVAELAEMLLGASNVRGLIILSLSLQTFLILFARLRKEGIGRKSFIRWSIWLAYLFLNSFSKNKLRLPTMLVLLAGITKCTERNFALFCASFAHLGMCWVSFNVNMGDDEREGKMGARLPIPVQFQGVEDHESTMETAVLLFGNLKSALVGPLLTKEEQKRIKRRFRKIKNSKEVLQVLKIELSLLYKLLHTKLPVIDSKIGFILRMANYGCILLALVLFSLAKRHYQLGKFGMLLTYGLLIGALALDFLSITLLFKHSDWLAISHFQKSNEGKVIARQDRPSNEVPQLNFITYHVKDMPVWLNKLVDTRNLRGLVRDIKGIRCQSSHSLDKEYD